MNNSITIILSVISLTSLIIGLYLYKKINPSKVTMGIFFIMVFSSILLFITYAVANYFTGNGVDEATIYHLKYGLSGAGFLEYKWLILITIIALILSAFCLLRFISKIQKNTNPHIINSLASFSFVSFSLLLNPASINIYDLQEDYLSSPSTRRNVWQEYCSNPNNNNYTKITNYFCQYYKNPYIKESANNHKNIVFIYAEGLERTYFDNTVFPGLIKGLRDIESKSIYFTNIKQVHRTGWTIAGLTASQCGIPLFIPSNGNSMSGMDQFLSSAVCIGDLLNEKGYQLNFMGGSYLDFAGKGKLFKTHGFTNVLGRYELFPALEDKAYVTGWGLYDDTLLDIAYNRFIELSESGDKFGLFTLTLDTHHPYGHPSKSCKGTEYKDASNQILNAVACSDYLLSNFINKISKTPYADNTIIVLASDHLAMRNTAYDLLKKTKNRKNLFMIIDPSKHNSMEIKTAGSTLDIGATLLPFLGYAGDIGLGRNLLNTKNLEKDRLFIHSNLKKWRQPITAFWDFPIIQNYVSIDIYKRLVSIDGRSFIIPILISLNNKLQSTIKFPYYATTANYESNKTLIKYRRELEDNDYFLLIDGCKNVRYIDKSLNKQGFCLLAGQGRKYTKIMNINKNIKYTANKIRQILNLSNLSNIPNNFIDK